MLGYQLARAAGIVVAIIGAVVGLLLGFLLMRLATQAQLLRFVRQLQETETQILRARLEGEYYVSHLIVSIPAASRRHRYAITACTCCCRRPLTSGGMVGEL